MLDLRVIDGCLAVLLTVGAVLDASSEVHHDLNALALASLVVMTGSVAVRHRNPVLTTLLAVTAFGAFQLTSRYSGDGAFEAAAIALNFYALGRSGCGRAGILVSAGVFAYWLLGALTVSYSVAGGSAAEVFASWIVLGGLPFAVGRTLTARSAMTRELQVGAARLESEQQARARAAAAQERSQMARELHDVIAHNVSVMVIQTSAVQRVASSDLDAARDALRAVERAGREALVELRRTVGVLHRSADELDGAAAPGISQLDALVSRAGAAGLTVDLQIEGQRTTLSAGLDLVVYRVVQEALTNAIKYAGPARAVVNVTFGSSELELRVSDSGQGLATESQGDGSGHGLVGMSERVRLYGGQLRAGPRPDGGFEVRARIPLYGGTPMPLARVPHRGDQDPVAVPGLEGFRWPWLDPLLAAVLLVALEVSVLVSSDRRGPVIVNMIVVAAMALAAIWRRSSPLAFLIVVGVLVIGLEGWLTSLNNLPLAGIYITLVPTYTVAAWEQRREAVLGLVIFICGTALSNAIVPHATLGDFIGGAVTVTAAWGAGRAIRARHVVTSELKRRSGRLVAEREDRVLLAVSGERSRIAREMHAAVAQTVAAMVVQAEATRRLLGREPAQVETALGAIEQAGRQTLVEMRRILGVLRYADDASELAPQPGVDQIYTLIERARDAGQPVELSVDGDPGTLPAGVDLGIYRILEEALKSVRPQQGAAVGVALRFGEQNLELHVTARCDGPSGWPTDAMRERLTLCGGELATDPHHENGWEFVARMPRGLQGALT